MSKINQTIPVNYDTSTIYKFLLGLFTRISAESQSGKDHLRFCRQSPDCFQLQTAPKISAFFSVSQFEIARLVLRLFKIEPDYTIAIDHTEWQWGAQWVNVLMLAITYKEFCA